MRMLHACTHVLLGTSAVSACATHADGILGKKGGVFDRVVTGNDINELLFTLQADKQQFMRAAACAECDGNEDGCGVGGEGQADRCRNYRETLLGRATMWTA